MPQDIGQIATHGDYELLTAMLQNERPWAEGVGQNRNLGVIWRSDTRRQTTWNSSAKPRSSKAKSSDGAGWSDEEERRERGK